MRKVSNQDFDKICSVLTRKIMATNQVLYHWDPTRKNAED